MKKFLEWIVRISAFITLLCVIVNFAISYIKGTLFGLDRVAVTINLMIVALILSVLCYIDYLIRRYGSNVDEMTNFNINIDGSYINNKIPQLIIDYDSEIIDEKTFIDKYVKYFIKKRTPMFYTDHMAYLWFQHQIKWDELSDDVRKLILKGQMNFLADELDDGDEE